MDVTYLKIKGKNAYLCRAFDPIGNTIDFFVSKTRDKAASKKFFTKALNAGNNQQPRVIIIDQYAAIEITEYNVMREHVDRFSLSILSVKDWA